MTTERTDIVVVGGGQAGLAVAYHLARHHLDFLVLEAGERLGGSWRARWDSLKLFTPAGFSRLPAMACPARTGRYQTKDEMADYLERYARHFAFPVRLGQRVERISRTGDRYLITAGERRIEASHVFVATGPFTTPYTPQLAGDLDPGILQLHSVDYRNPEQLREGPVLVVGAGNSGAEIAEELAARHTTWLAGRDTGYVPFPMGSLVYRMMRRLSVSSWPGRAIAAAGTGRGHPLISVSPDDLAKAGVRRAPRVEGVENGRPLLADGTALDVANIVWSTGFVPDYRWIDLPVLHEDGTPRHHRGIVTTEPGLYFVGLPFQSTVASHLVGGVGADARYLVDRLVRSARSSKGGPRRVTAGT